MKNFLYLWLYLAHFFLEWKLFRQNYIENQKTNFVFSKFNFENRATYVIIWKNIVDPDRPQMTM